MQKRLSNINVLVLSKLQKLKILTKGLSSCVKNSSFIIMTVLELYFSF